MNDIRKKFLNRSPKGSSGRIEDEALVERFDNARLGEHPKFLAMLEALLPESNDSARHAKAAAYRLLARAEAEFNPLQRKIVELYCGGDMAHVKNMKAAETAGDTLFLFCLREATGAGVDVTEYTSMLDSAIEQLEALKSALEGK